MHQLQEHAPRPTVGMLSNPSQWTSGTVSIATSQPQGHTGCGVLLYLQVCIHSALHRAGGPENVVGTVFEDAASPEKFKWGKARILGGMPSDVSNAGLLTRLQKAGQASVTQTPTGASQ